MIYVHSRTERVADDWAREQGFRPRDYRTYGDRSWRSLEGRRYYADDRIIVVGDVSERIEDFIRRNLQKCPEPRPVPEWYLAMPIPR